MTLADLLADPQHKAALEATLPAYIAAQRWFGAKTRHIQSAAIAQHLPIFETDAVLAILDLRYTEGAPERYQLPLAAAASTQAIPITAIAGHNLFDATADPQVRAALLRMTLAGDVSSDSPADAPSRVSSAEQSNTSIIFADRLILKLFRKLEPGENPDVEISRFLTTVAGFPHIPAFRGSLSAEDGATLAFAQDFIPNDGDGWQWMTTRLAALLASSAPLADDDETLAAAALLGRRTAALHLALATPTDDPAFCATPLSHADLAADAARLQAQAESTFSALRAALPTAPADLTTTMAALLARRSAISAVAQSLATASPFRAGLRIRIHGDFHLGQVLRSKALRSKALRTENSDNAGSSENSDSSTEPDFILVDFEGEPARPLADRRRKQTPLRDVAGMLRSFSYAAASAAATAKTAPSADVLARQSAWEAAASARFLDAYNQTIALLPELAPQTESTALLLRACLLEKALYELLYELNNRPSWIAIPLRGVLALLEPTA